MNKKNEFEINLERLQKLNELLPAGQTAIIVSDEQKEFLSKQIQDSIRQKINEHQQLTKEIKIEKDTGIDDETERNDRESIDKIKAGLSSLLKEITNHTTKEDERFPEAKHYEKELLEILLNFRQENLFQRIALDKNNVSKKVSEAVTELISLKNLLNSNPTSLILAVGNDKTLKVEIKNDFLLKQILQLFQNDKKFQELFSVEHKIKKGAKEKRYIKKYVFKLFEVINKIEKYRSEKGKYISDKQGKCIAALLKLAGYETTYNNILGIVNAGKH